MLQSNTINCIFCFDVFNEDDYDLRNRGILELGNGKVVNIESSQHGSGQHIILKLIKSDNSPPIEKTKNVLETCMRAAYAVSGEVCSLGSIFCML